MEKMKELWEELYKLPPDQENIETCKTLSFEILELYCTIPRKDLGMDDINAACGAAMKLSGLIQKGLTKRVRAFLQKHGKALPTRAVQVLEANYMRMAGF